MTNPSLKQDLLALLALALVTLASLACGSGIGGRQDTAEPTVAPPSLAGPTSTPLPTRVVTTDKPEPVDSNPVSLVPLAAVESDFHYYWRRRAEPGWVYLYVLLAVENSSDEYQAFQTNAYGARLVTAEGYSYAVDHGYLTTKEPIPPGFRVWGHYAPGGANPHLNCLLFRIGEMTSGYELQIPGFPPLSLSDVPGKLSETDLERLSLSLEWGIGGALPALGGSTDSLDLPQVFPSSSSAPRPLEQGDLLAVGAYGEMTVISSSTQDRLLTVALLYRNKSGGYGQKFPLAYYVIGDDGVLRPQKNFSMVYREVGPGQEMEYKAEFYVRPGTDELRLVALGEEGTRGVFRLMPSDTSESLSTHALHWERFDVNFIVLNSSNLEIEEIQEIVFHAGTYRYGYRNIPIGDLDNITDVEVWEGNRPYDAVGTGDYTYRTTVRDGELQIRWDFPQTSNSRHTFILRYTVEGGLRYEADGDQLYWWAVFADRDFPVHNSTVTVRLPENATADSVAAYSTEASITGQCTNTVVFKALDRIPPGQGFKIRVQFPHGMVQGSKPGS